MGFKTLKMRFVEEGGLKFTLTPRLSQVDSGLLSSSILRNSLRRAPLLVAFAWELTKETINLLLGCL